MTLARALLALPVHLVEIVWWHAFKRTLRDIRL